MQKISGFAKFDVDTKVTKKQFFHLLEALSMELESEEEAQSRIATAINTVSKIGVTPAHVTDATPADLG